MNESNKLNTKVGPPVTVRVKGGVGNQLFIYAFGLALSSARGVPLALDTISGFTRDPYKRKYKLDRFGVKPGFSRMQRRYQGSLGPFLRRFDRYLSSCKPFEKRAYVEESSMRSCLNLGCFPHRQEVYYDGYWQCLSLFSNLQSELAERLNINLTHESVRQLARLIDGEELSVAVHFRSYGEVPNGPGPDRIGADYYRRARQIVLDAVGPRVIWFVFSDDPNWARAMWKSGEEVVFVADIVGEDGDEIDELNLMRYCRHHVIANSTFSWWGAWLGRYPHGIVVCPSFRGTVGHDRMLPKDWMMLS